MFSIRVSTYKCGVMEKTQKAKIMIQNTTTRQRDRREEKWRQICVSVFYFAPTPETNILSPQATARGAPSKRKAEEGITAKKSDNQTTGIRFIVCHEVREKIRDASTEAERERTRKWRKNRGRKKRSKRNCR